MYSLFVRKISTANISLESADRKQGKLQYAKSPLKFLNARVNMKNENREWFIKHKIEVVLNYFILFTKYLFISNQSDKLISNHLEIWKNILRNLYVIIYIFFIHLMNEIFSDGFQFYKKITSFISFALFISSNTPEGFREQTNEKSSSQK